jgi:hypothetical protein
MRDDSVATVPAMPRRVMDSGPFTFDQLELPNASECDLSTARHVMEKFFPNVTLSFSLFAVPLAELLESNFVDAVLRKQMPAEAYHEWRQRGASEQELRALFEAAGDQQRQRPEFADELPRVEMLERQYRAGESTDPLIAASIQQPLSTGWDALFIVDGRHRLIAAAATGVDELEVYVGTPVAPASAPGGPAE